MKKIKLFDLIERSFIGLRKTNKKIWIIGIIISIFSGGLLIDESLDEEWYPNLGYENEYYDEGQDSNNMIDNSFSVESFESLISYAIVVILIFMAVVIILGILINVITYYLCHSVYEALFDTKLDRASLGLVVKVNSIVILKFFVGLILFIIPGIVVAVKYAPVNYILCKHPELSSKEILNKTKSLSKGFKWKIFTFNLLITIIGSIILFVCTPNTFVSGSTFIDVLSMLITLILTSFMTVYSGLFNIYLYKDIDNLKDISFVE